MYRIVTPEIDFINNVVSVNIEIIHFDRKTNRINEFNEIHKMRYLFDPEIESLFKKFGFCIFGVYTFAFLVYIFIFQKGYKEYQIYIYIYRIIDIKVF